MSITQGSVHGLGADKYRTSSRSVKGSMSMETGQNTGPGFSSAAELIMKAMPCSLFAAYAAFARPLQEIHEINAAKLVKTHGPFTRAGIPYTKAGQVNASSCLEAGISPSTICNQPWHPQNNACSYSLCQPAGPWIFQGHAICTFAVPMISPPRTHFTTPAGH